MKPFAVQVESIRDTAPTVSRCAFCDYRHEGTALEGRAAFAAHLRDARPERTNAAVKRLLGRVKEMDKTKGVTSLVPTHARERSHRALAAPRL